jgi:Flp pilus assembly secretin CpaC
MNSYIAQASAPVTSVPTTGNAPLDTGIGVTLAFFVGTILKSLFERGLHTFEKKDEAEASLNSALINDIRATNQAMIAVLPEIRLMMQQMSGAVQDMRSSIERVSAAHNTEIERIRRANLELIVEMREQQQKILHQLEEMKLKQLDSHNHKIMEIR